LRKIPVFRRNYGLKSLREILEIRIWRPGDVVKATGIPPHACLIGRMNKMEKDMKELECNMSIMMESQRVMMETMMHVRGNQPL